MGLIMTTKIILDNIPTETVDDRTLSEWIRRSPFSGPPITVHLCRFPSALASRPRTLQHETTDGLITFLYHDVCEARYLHGSHCLQISEPLFQRAPSKSLMVALTFALALKAMDEGGMIVHAAGFQVRTAAGARNIIAVAPANGGKTTLSWRLIAEGHRVLHDEGVVIQHTGECYVASAIPDVARTDRLPVCCGALSPVHKIVFLRKSGANRLVPADPSTALEALRTEVFNRRLNATTYPRSYELCRQNTHRFIGRVQAAFLEFGIAQSLGELDW
jgi:hypothetical protein